MLRLLSLAATVASVSATVAANGIGPADNGDFCGDTGLGPDAALLDAISGQGTIAYTSGGDVTGRTISIVKNQIVVNYAAFGQSSVVAKKEIECVYTVALNYDDSTVEVKTGPPGVVGLANEQRCWRFKLDSDSLMTFRRNDKGETCPQATGTVDSVGSITGFGDTVEAKFKGTCPNATTAAEATPTLKALPNAFVGTGADGFITPTSITDLASTAFPLVQLCLTGGITNLNAADSAADAFPFYSATVSSTSAATSACVQFKLNNRVGALQAITSAYSANPTCAAWSNANAVAVPVVLPFIAPPGAGGAPAAAAAPTKLESRPVVTFSLSFPSTINLTPLEFADPCNAVKLRQSAAAAVPGASVNTVLLTTLVQGSATVTLLPNSPGNVFSSLPSFCTARRLLFESSLRSPRSLRLEAARAAAADSGRALQGSNLNIGVTTVLPAGASAATLANSLTSSPPNIAFGSASAAVSGAAAATATVPVPVTYPARKNPYIPDSLIAFFHNIPRFALGGETPSNTFSIDMAYIQGALFPAGGIIALAIISLILYAIAYTCGCCACQCCKCRKKRDPALYEQGCKKKFGPTKAIKVFGALNIALILSVIAYLPKFAEGVQTLADAFDDFTAVVRSAAAVMSSSANVVSSAGNSIPSIKSSTALAAAAAQSASTTCAGGSPPCNTAVTQIIDAVKSGADTASNAGADTGEILSDLAELLAAARGTVDVESIKSMLTMAGYAVLGILCFILLVFTLMTCKNRLASCVYKVLAPLNILLVTLVIILAGAYYAIGIIGSDLCIAPTDTLLFFASQTGMDGGFAGETLRYYLTCGPEPATPAMGAYKMVLDTVGTIGGAVKQIANLDSQMTATPSSPAYSAITNPPTTYIGTMKTQMGNAQEAIQTLADNTLSCSAIDPIISKIFEGLCNDGIATVIGIFRILIAASVLLIIQLGIGVDICCFHPGDKSRWLGEDEKSAKVLGTSPGPAGAADGGTANAAFQNGAPAGVPKQSGTGTHV